jgi:hypothetical protein
LPQLALIVNDVGFCIDRERQEKKIKFSSRRGLQNIDSQKDRMCVRAISARETSDGEPICFKVSVIAIELGPS